MFFLECTIGPSWAVPMDAGGKYSGTVSGMMNMAGNYRRRAVAAGVRRPGAVRQLAGAVRRRGRLLVMGCGLGILARSGHLSCR